MVSYSMNVLEVCFLEVQVSSKSQAWCGKLQHDCVLERNVSLETLGLRAVAACRLSCHVPSNVATAEVYSTS